MFSDRGVCSSSNVQSSFWRMVNYTLVTQQSLVHRYILNERKLAAKHTLRSNAVWTGAMRSLSELFCARSTTASTIPAVPRPCSADILLSFSELGEQSLPVSPMGRRDETTDSVLPPPLFRSTTVELLPEVARE